MSDYNYDANGNPLPGAEGPMVPPKKGLPWLWILAGAAVLWYFVGRKKA